MESPWDGLIRSDIGYKCLCYRRTLKPQLSPSNSCAALSPEERLKVVFLWFQMQVIVGDFGIVVVPRDGADTERIMNHSSILRKYKVRAKIPLFTPCSSRSDIHIYTVRETSSFIVSSDLCVLFPVSGQHHRGERCHEPPNVYRQLNQEQVGIRLKLWRYYYWVFSHKTNVYFTWPQAAVHKSWE